MDKILLQTVQNAATPFEVSECLKIIKILSSQGTNMNVKNLHGFTLLHIAVLKQSTSILKALVDAGADVNLENSKGQTALNFVINFVKNPLCKNEMVKTLVSAGADVNTKSKDGGTTVLQVAAAAGDVDLVQFLIDQGADVNIQDEAYYYWTALHYAAGRATSEDPAIFEVLLSSGADPHAQDSEGDTPIHMLAKLKSKLPICQIIQVFARHAADFQVVNNKDSTPMDVAISRFNNEAVKALVLHAGVSVNSLFHTTEHSSGSSKTILYQACDNNDLPTVKFLLKHGADVNAVNNDNEPIVRAVIRSIIIGGSVKSDVKQAKEILEYLLKWNPDLNILTKQGCNVLSPCFEYELPNDLWPIVIQHISKVYVTEAPVHPSVLQTILYKPEYDRYFKKCNRELLRAKLCMLREDYAIAYYNMLADDKRKLLKYAGNYDIAKVMAGRSKIVKKFPIYGPLMHHRFSKAVEKMCVWNKAAHMLCDLLPIDLDPDHRVVVKILNFCKLKELKNLCI